MFHKVQSTKYPISERELERIQNGSLSLSLPLSLSTAPSVKGPYGPNKSWAIVP